MSSCLYLAEDEWWKWGCCFSDMVSHSLWSCFAIITFRHTPLRCVTEHPMLVIPESLSAFIVFIVLSMSVTWLLAFHLLIQIFFRLPTPAWSFGIPCAVQAPFCRAYHTLGTSVCSHCRSPCPYLRDVLQCARVWSRSSGKRGFSTWNVSFTERFLGRTSY